MLSFNSPGFYMGGEERSLSDNPTDKPTLAQFEEKKSKFLESSLLGSIPLFFLPHLSPCLICPRGGDTQWGCLKDLPAPPSGGLGLGRWQRGGLKTAWGSCFLDLTDDSGSITETVCLGRAPPGAQTPLPPTNAGNPAFPNCLWHSV